MDNKTINEIAAQIAQNYETAEIPMYGQRLCLPDRASVIAILELLQKLLFPAYFGDTQLLRLPPPSTAPCCCGAGGKADRADCPGHRRLHRRQRCRRGQSAAAAAARDSAAALEGPNRQL